MIQMGRVKGADPKDAVIVRRSPKKRQFWRKTALPEAQPQNSVTAQFSFKQLGQRFTAVHLSREIVRCRSEVKARLRESSSNVLSPQPYLYRYWQKRRAACPDRNKLYGHRTLEDLLVFGHSGAYSEFRRDLHGHARSGGSGHRLGLPCAR
jgi:hypothetical protein